MAKGNSNKSSSSSPQNLNNTIAELKKQVSSMENKINQLEKVDSLESKVVVSSKLEKEIDRLNQYHRRSVRNVFLPEKEINKDLDNKIIKMISKDLNLTNVIPDIDKLHRIGKVKERNGKKTQDVIVKFKSHSARYLVYKKRKKGNNIKISPNLTNRKSMLLYEAAKRLENVETVNFAFADIHGDLNIRLQEEYQGKFLFTFNSIADLNELLREVGMDEDLN